MASELQPGPLATPFPVLSTRHVKQRLWRVSLTPAPSLGLYFHPRRVRLLVFLTNLIPKVQNLYSEWAEERNGLCSHIQSSLIRWKLYLRC